MIQPQPFNIDLMKMYPQLFGVQQPVMPNQQQAIGQLPQIQTSQKKLPSVEDLIGQMPMMGGNKMGDAKSQMNNTGMMGMIKDINKGTSFGDSLINNTGLGQMLKMLGVV